MSKNSEEMAPSFEEFMSLPYSAFQVSVVNFISKTFQTTTYTVEFLVYAPDLNISSQYTVNRRYTEFKNLYDEFCDQKNPKIKFPEFPPKVQLVGKEENRIKYFDSLLKTIYDLGKNNKAQDKELKMVLYDFIFEKQDFKTEPLSALKLKKVFKVSTKNTTDAPEKNKVPVNSDWTDVTHEQTPKPKNSNNSLKGLEKTQSNNDFIDFNELNPEWSQIKVKSSIEKYRNAHIKINEQCLFVYRSYSDKNFYLLIPLYKINIDVFRIMLKGEYGRIHRYVTPSEIDALCKHSPKTLLSDISSEIEIRLYHDYDSFAFFVNFPSKHNIYYVNSFVKTTLKNSNSGTSKSMYISKIDKTNMNIYGNIFVELIRVNIEGYEGKCLVKVQLEPYTFQTKEMFYFSTFEINQGFILPLHNRFISLIFSVYKLKEEGILKKKNVEEKVGELSIELPELLNNFFISKDIIKIAFNDKITLEFKFKNCSSLLALAAKNKNKKIIEDCPLENDEKDEEHFTVGMCMKRIKRIMLMFSLFKLFFQNVFRFKYPVFSSVLMVLMMMYFIFCQTKYILTHILVLLGIILFSFSKVYQKYFGRKVQSYLFSYRNPYDEDSLYVHTIDEEKNKQMGQNQYLVAKEKKRFSFPSIKRLKEYRQTYVDFIFSITKIVAVMEKIKNLFLWTDPLLSFYFFTLVVALLLIVYNVEIRLLLLVSFTKKFIGGIFYYKNKIKNNKAIARIIINYSKEKMKAQKLFSKINQNTAFFSFENEKIVEIITKHFRKYAEIEIDPEIFKKITHFKELINEVGKCSEMVRIKKTSKLYHFQKEDPDTFVKPVEPEDVFIYFVHNIKSDYYMAKHNLCTEEDKSELLEEKLPLDPLKDPMKPSDSADNKDKSKKDYLKLKSFESINK